MPDTSFNLETEVNYYSNVLVIDEVGGVSTLLIDDLLHHGCLIYYYGKEEKETFHYLQGKDNFRFLNSSSEINQLEKLDYLFYFPAEEKSEEISNFVWLLEKHRTKLLVCTDVENQEREKLAAFVERKEVNARLAVFNLVFGPRIKKGLLGNLFLKGKRGEKATVSEKPSKKIYPLFAKSLVGELVRLIFAPDSKGNSYFIQGKEIKLSEFVGLLQNLWPTTKVEFLNGQQTKKIPTSFKKIKVEQRLEEEIAETAEWFERNVLEESRVEESFEEKKLVEELALRSAPEPDSSEKKLDFLFSSLPKSEQEKEAKKETSPFKKILFGTSFFLSLFFLFFALPLFLSGAFGLQGIKQLVQLRKAVEEGNFSRAIKKSASAQNNFAFSQKTLSLAGPFYALIGLEKQLEQISEVFRFCQNANGSLKLALVSAEELVNMTDAFVKGETPAWEEELGTIKSNLSYAYEQASLAQSSLESSQKGFEFLRQKEAYQKLKKYLPQNRELLLKGQRLLTVLPKILGLKERKTYLFLLQNNMELRPTGGFIGSYALVNLEAGKLVNFEVFDVYQADGQLKGHVEPPAQLKKYLGEGTWYLRDSNWDPDFVLSAKRAQWFLDKEMQVSVDGTIALTLKVAQNLLASLGEVSVPEYEETINADNLFERAEYYSELGTFPGSTQKKDFLGSLARALYQRIREAEPKDLVNVAAAIFSSLEQKEILLFFNDEEVELVVTALGWEGGIRNFQPKESPNLVFADYLHLNEANVGINKANYFVEREIKHEIVLGEEGNLEEKLTLSYENKSSSNTWPAGQYRAYLRLYLPQGTRISSVLTTDPQNPSLWLPYENRYLDYFQEHDKSVVGVLLEVPIQSKRILEVKYELAQNFELSSRVNTYLLMLQKQSGAHASNYSLTFSYPKGFVPVRVIPSAVMGSGQLLVTEKLDKDKIFQIDLAH
ncbi:MAG TPA: DUF4012 domain-containing protein [Clostridia bacterium]|nr:DUF4012 domain-containing protein [Clostridia bacterium]